MTGTEDAGPAALPPGQMSETEFRSLYDRLRGQQRLQGFDPLRCCGRGGRRGAPAGAAAAGGRSPFTPQQPW